MSIMTPDMFGRAAYTLPPVQKAITTASSTAAMTVGHLYLIHSDNDVRFIQGSAAAVATTTSNMLFGRTYFGPVYASAAAVGFIAAITASGTATLELIAVEG